MHNRWLVQDILASLGQVEARIRELLAIVKKLEVKLRQNGGGYDGGTDAAAMHEGED